MIINDTVNTIEKIGEVTSEAQFKMKTSRKAFQILSDLYSDKPLAIIRELGCNAADSMVAAGKGDQPFHIHLPNSLEPYLVIQDFGTGISHQNIYDIYSTYFESTKTQTNDQVGCLGLGSKSPFCYTDSFTVTSIHNGEKRIYNAFFNEQSTPAIALMSTEDTTESNGLKIQIPVKNGDFHLFSEAVLKAFRFFDVKPTITGGTVNWDALKPIFSGDDWMIFESLKNSYERAFAIMGGVAYPIDLYNHKIAYADGKHDFNSLLRNGLVMRFNIGELDFTPSREALSYDDQTVQALVAKMKKVLVEMPQKLESTIQEKETILDALKASFFFREKFYWLSSNKVEIKWNGLDISEPHQFFKKLAPGVLHYRKKEYRSQASVSNMVSFNEMDWYVDDIQRGADRRMKHFVRNERKEALLFTEKDHANLIANGFSADLFKSVGVLPSPTSTRVYTSGNGTKVTKAKEDITVYTLGERHKDTWESKIITPNDDAPKFYIPKGSNWQFSIKLNQLYPISSKGMVSKILTALNIDADKDFVMVSKRAEEQLIERGAVNFVEWFNNGNGFDIDIEELSTAYTYNGYSYLLDSFKNPLFAELSDSNPIKMAITKIVELTEKYIKFRGFWMEFETADHNKATKFSFSETQKYLFDNLTNCTGSRVNIFLKLAKEIEK